jgi:hypothetical protein
MRGEKVLVNGTMKHNAMRDEAYGVMAKRRNSYSVKRGAQVDGHIVRRIDDTQVDIPIKMVYKTLIPSKIRLLLVAGAVLSVMSLLNHGVTLVDSLVGRSTGLISIPVPESASDNPFALHLDIHLHLICSNGFTPASRLVQKA